MTRAAVLLTIALLAAAAPGQAQPRGAPRAVPVTVTPVVERAVADEVRFIATIEPSIATTVGAEVAGRVVEVGVRDGDRVAAGTTVLARLDAGPREIQLREAMAVVAGAREELAKLRRGSRDEELGQRAAELAEQDAILDRAEQDYRRAQRLHRDELISLAELQRAESEYRAVEQKRRRALEAHRMAEAGPRPEEIAQAGAQLAEARARADRIQDEIRRGTIVAPINGYIVRKRVDLGAWVQPGTPVADLVALDPVEVTGPVGEREIRRVRPGQTAAVVADAYPGQTFQGTVTAVVPSADAARTFPVKIRVANPEGLLKAGMFARVALRAGRGRTALFVPKDAVVRRGGQELLFLVEGDQARLVRVETGARVEGLVEVRGDGLAAGKRAVTLGNEFLQPGMKVQVTR